MNIKDLLSAVIGLAGAGVAVWQFVRFMQHASPEGNSTALMISIIAAVVACVCGVVFFVGRVNKEEEFHITQ